MKQYWHLILVVALLIGSGCASKPKAERERISTKSSLKAGDKILYEDDTDMILSLDNDSMVVRRNLTDGTDDTILTTPLELRMSILSSPERILVVHKVASDDSIGLLSYDIESRHLESYRADGLGYKPDLAHDKIDIALVREYKGSVYEGAYNVTFALQESEAVLLGRKVGVTQQKAAEIRRSSESFWSSNSDRYIYWWECAWCKKSVTSHSRPPEGGCSSKHFHAWIRGNRAN